MTGPDKPSLQRLFLLAMALIALALLAGTWRYSHRSAHLVTPHAYSLQPGQTSEWKAVGGKWAFFDGAAYNTSEERGAKLLTGSTQWRDYTVNADLQLGSEHGDMGLILRSNDEKSGIDAYNGYYVGLRTSDGTVVIGRSDYGWTEARPMPIPGGVHAGVWYHLRATAVGCNIAASAENLQTLQTAWIAFGDRSCIRTGRIGLRSVDTGGIWHNVSVANAGWNDYMLLRQHASSVERPAVLDGPPWWTPWHAGMLFAGALAAGLLCQLIYFRMQRWKTYTITHERERLALEIHDTMAQSFAGVGYQIQGIRSSVLRSDWRDADHIAEQLNVAYQLIRRCHEEASRTIAMLGASPPPIQQNLLGTLSETARKIAGNRIRTVARLQGTSTPLNLRLANALLHIGQEAIANAVTHADPTLLAITLTYDSRTVELMIEDNGRGFRLTPEKAGVGIWGMEKRAREIAAKFYIVSSPQTGTQVRVKARL